MTKTEQEFQRWLSCMDEALGGFLAALPPEVRDNLDYSGASLDALEAWLLNRYPSPTRVKHDPQVFDGTARYIGETYRRTLGGRWWVDPKGKILDGWPHVLGFRTSNGWICPLIEATAATHRRTGKEIRTVWRNMFRWLAGKESKNPLIDDPNMRKHLKVWEEEKEFSYWLKRMDEELGYLKVALPNTVSAQLENSVESLDTLERWLLDRYPDGDAARDETQVLTLDGVARYIGQTFIAQLGGKWWFDLFGWSHNGLPQVTEFSAEGVEPEPVCPLVLAHAAADLRRGDTWSSALRVKRRSDEDAA